MSKAIGNVTEISSCKDNHAKDQGQDSKPNVTRYKNGKPLDHSSYEHGSAIKEARIAANVKQEDLGIFLGDNPKGTISSIEKNLFAPRIEYLAPIAYRLHMKAEDIVGVKSDAVDPEDELSIEEREAILLYRSMTEAQQQAALLIANGLAMYTESSKKGCPNITEVPYEEIGQNFKPQQ